MNSFNNVFLNNWKDLNHARVGLEFEFFSNHSYIKTMELLNNEFDGIHVHGFNQYHSDFEPTSTDFKIEPDFSGGSDMIELITGPLSWVDARVVLIKMCEWIRRNGYTDSHCSIHVNVSFDDMRVLDMDTVKLILNLDEDYIYEKFPSRRNNIYARSIKWIVPFEDYVDSETAYGHILQALHVPDDTKYYGVNLQKKVDDYLEFRYIGGDDYEKKTDEILCLMDYFIMTVRKCIKEPLNGEDEIKLRSYLEDNINWFKKYKTYDQFLANIDGVKIEVDRKKNYVETCNNWDKFKDRLFAFVKACTTLNGGTINYNTDDNSLEIVEANVAGISYLKGVEFVECVLSDVLLYDCTIVQGSVQNGHIYNSKILEVDVLNSKLTNCKAMEYSTLTNCLFDGDFLDCTMRGGVFRAGSVGENADIDASVKMSNRESFWKVDAQDKKINKKK